jgi:hypothetical protein
MSFYLDIDEDIAADLLNTEETGIARVIKHARAYLWNAVLLWQMLDPERAARLKRLVTEEIRYPPTQATFTLRRDQVERLIELLKDIEIAAVGKIMDKDYHVLPEKVDYVNESAPGLAVRTTDGKGNTLYVLDRITEIEWLRAFLEKAIELDIDVIEA